jgi:hypothetical protein
MVTTIGERWPRPDAEVAQADLFADLTAAGVDAARLAWLPLDENRAVVRQWMELGAQRWGRLSLNPPATGRVRRGEYADDELPPWLVAPPHDVIVMFFRPATDYLLARCAADFAVAERVRLARTDRDGFGALTPSLDAGLLVNVESRLGDAALDFDGWGSFVRVEA